MKTAEKEALERARKLELEPEPVTDIRELQKQNLDEAESLRKLLKPARFVEKARRKN
ncbi:hypothetical protein J4211_02335 [Candidatus Woesearchaeota archaeon]|nr:hypothetical protein [Candidatus Woesearchaeota archaeon]